MIFYQDKPIFGLDVGFSSVKVIQIEQHNSGLEVVGYGTVMFDRDAIVDGVIVNPELIAKEVKTLFTDNLVGRITTRRVVLSVPAANSYIRSIKLPVLPPQELADAIRLETEEYVPIAADDMHLDYTLGKVTGEEQEVLVAAVSKKLVDSYVALSNLLGLETVAVETTINGVCRMFSKIDVNHTPTVLVDLGSRSSDITVYDDGVVVTSTVPGGGESFSEVIAQKLGVTHREAHLIKTRYGLGVSKKQSEIVAALDPLLGQLSKEIKRMVKYYEERSAVGRKIDQVVTMGGGANMLGLADYLTNALRLPVRVVDPWQELKLRKLDKPPTAEKAMYATAAGMALVDPKEIFA